VNCRRIWTIRWCRCMILAVVYIFILAMLIGISGGWCKTAFKPDGPYGQM
jgi:hypothetical protein